VDFNGALKNANAYCELQYMLPGSRAISTAKLEVNPSLRKTFHIFLCRIINSKNIGISAIETIRLVRSDVSCGLPGMDLNNNQSRLPQQLSMTKTVVDKRENAGLFR
jgi:hypothetical protein